jgi:hypothetical protein
VGVNDVGNAVQRLIRRNVLRSCGQLWQDSARLGLSLLLVGMDVAALKGEVRAASHADDLGDEAQLARACCAVQPLSFVLRHTKRRHQIPTLPASLGVIRQRGQPMQRGHKACGIVAFAARHHREYLAYHHMGQ